MKTLNQYINEKLILKKPKGPDIEKWRLEMAWEANEKNFCSDKYDNNGDLFATMKEMEAVIGFKCEEFDSEFDWSGYEFWLKVDGRKCHIIDCCWDRSIVKTHNIHWRIFTATEKDFDYVYNVLDDKLTELYN
jgi:hypothetical protein